VRCEGEMVALASIKPLQG
jgi:hypothetical protein